MLIEHIKMCLDLREISDIQRNWRNVVPQRIAKYAFSLVRRYTTYNRYDALEMLDAAPFSVRDIFIAPFGAQSASVPGRWICVPVKVPCCGTVCVTTASSFTAEQICEHTWGMESSDNHETATISGETKK